MNLATATLLTFMAFLLSILVEFGVLKYTLANRIHFVYTIAVLVIVCFLSSIDISLFKAWGSKISRQAISYMRYPKEVLPTIFVANNLKYIAIGIAQFFAFYGFYKKCKIQILDRVETKGIFLKTMIVLVGFGLGIVIIRGGVKGEVLSRNNVFHSGKGLLNFTALNSLWNLLDLATAPAKLAENYRFMSAQEAKDWVEKMHTATKDTSVIITNGSRINILVIMLESFGSDVVESVDGEKGVTPNFSKLAKEGILFNHFYSTGNRTEQGLLAILSAIPSQPTKSMIHDFDKLNNLPNLFKTLGAENYQTSFYYGGHLSFDNMEAYLGSAGVKHLIGEADLNAHKRTKWGAYDADLFAFQLHELQGTIQPFFSVLATLTSHEWFEAEVPQIFKKDADHVNDDYRNTIHYTDSCLYGYINALKKEKWYSNTLVFLVADHACKFPKYRNHYETERHRIPMLITGGALKAEFRGTINPKVGSQVDIASTILNQMGIKTKDFPRSKNLMNPYEPIFAWYSFDHGFGIVTNKDTIVYDYNQNRMLKSSSHVSIYWLNTGKAYMQYNSDAANCSGQNKVFSKQYLH